MLHLSTELNAFSYMSLREGIRHCHIGRLEYRMPGTHLQRQSSDIPASVHTKCKPEETNLPAVNSSETNKRTNTQSQKMCIERLRGVFSQQRELALLNSHSTYFCASGTRAEQDARWAAGEEASAHGQPGRSVLRPCRSAMRLESTHAQQPGL